MSIDHVLETSSAKPADSAIPRRMSGVVGFGAAFVVELFSLSLWLGGLIVIGALAAPTVFHALQTAPELAANKSAQTSIAGSIVRECFRAFNILSYVCAALLLLTTWWSAASNAQMPKSAVVARIVFITAPLILGLIQGFGLMPAMEAARIGGRTHEFDEMHYTYVNLSVAQLFLLTGYVVSRGVEAAKATMATANP